MNWSLVVPLAPLIGLGVAFLALWVLCRPSEGDGGSRPWRSRARLMTLTALAVALGPAASSAMACANADARAGEASGRKLARATLCLLNEERAARGLSPLRRSRRLSRAARAHTRDMVQRRFFRHVSRHGGFVARVSRTGYLNASSWLIGENLGWGSGGKSRPRWVVAAWMHSRGHRRNILTRRFDEIGVGVISRAPKRTFLPAATYTTIFGERH